MSDKATKHEVKACFLCPTTRRHEIIDRDEKEVIYYMDGEGHTQTTDRKDRTARMYNLHLITEADCDDHGMPILDPVDIDLEGISLVSFKTKQPAEKAGAHYFLEDYAFDNTWRHPERYAEALKRFAFTLTPDFSCFLEMPSPMQRWNVYRSRALGRIWQDAGLTVVPTVTWGLEDTYLFAFDGIPEASTLAFSSVGLMRGKEGKAIFRDGAEAACEYLEPRKIICYGTPCEFDSNGAAVVWVKSEMQERFDQLKAQREMKEVC